MRAFLPAPRATPRVSEREKNHCSRSLKRFGARLHVGHQRQTQKRNPLVSALRARRSSAARAAPRLNAGAGAGTPCAALGGQNAHRYEA